MRAGGGGVRVRGWRVMQVFGKIFDRKSLELCVKISRVPTSTIIAIPSPYSTNPDRCLLCFALFCFVVVFEDLNNILK